MADTDFLSMDSLLTDAGVPTADNMAQALEPAEAPLDGFMSMDEILGDAGVDMGAVDSSAFELPPADAIADLPPIPEQEEKRVEALPGPFESIGKVIAEFASSISPIPPAMTEEGQRIEFTATPEERESAQRGLEAAAVGIEIGLALTGAGLGTTAIKQAAKAVARQGFTNVALVAGSPYAQGATAITGAIFGDLFGRQINRELGLSEQTGGFFDPLRKFNFRSGEEALDTLTDNPIFIELGGPIVGRALKRTGRFARIEGRKMLREVLGVGQAESKKAMQKSFKIREKEVGFKKLEDQLDEDIAIAVGDGLLIDAVENADALIAENESAIKRFSEAIESQIREVDAIGGKHVAKWDTVKDYVNSRPPSIRGRAKKIADSITAAHAADSDGSLMALHQQKKQVYDLISNLAFLKDPNTSQQLTHQINRAVARDLKLAVENAADAAKGLSSGERESIKQLNRALSARMNIRTGLMTNKVRRDSSPSLLAATERNVFEGSARAVGGLVTPSTDVRPAIAATGMLAGEAMERIGGAATALSPAVPALTREREDEKLRSQPLPVILGIPISSYDPETNTVNDLAERGLIVERLGKHSGMSTYERMKTKSLLNRTGEILDRDLVDLPESTRPEMTEPAMDEEEDVRVDESGKVEKKY